MENKLDSQENIQEFFDWLESSDPALRRRGLANLWNVLPAQADKILEASITILEKDEDGDVRKRAAYLIAKVGGDSAVKALLTAFHKEVNSGLRGELLLALGRTHDKNLFDFLVNLLEDKTKPEILRTSAAQGLGYLKDTRALEPLSKALNDKMLWPMGIILGLEQLGGEGAVDLLIKLLRDSDVYIRSLVIIALGNLGDKRAIPALEWVRDNDKNIDEHYGSLSALAGSRAARVRGTSLKNLDEFVSTFREGDVYTRCRIAELLGERANPDAIDFLITALDDPEEQVRYDVLQALAKIRDARAIPALEEFARKDTSGKDRPFTLSENALDIISYIKCKQNE